MPLYIIVYPNGGKYFVWRYRFRPTREGQRRDYQIGPYGKGVGKWSLKQAKDKVIRLDQLRKAGEDPRLLKSEAKREVLQQALTLSVKKAAEWFLDCTKNKPSTINDDRKILFKQVLPVLDPERPINRFEWSVRVERRSFNSRKASRQEGPCIRPTSASW